MQGNGWFTTDSPVHIQMSNSNQGTGTFPEMWVSAANTVCCVKGVSLDIYRNTCIYYNVIFMLHTRIILLLSFVIYFSVCVIPEVFLLYNICV